MSKPIPEPVNWSDSVIGRSCRRILKLAPNEIQGRILCAKVIMIAFSPVCILDDFIPVLYLPWIFVTPDLTHATPKPAVGGKEVAKLVAAKRRSKDKLE